MSLYGLEDFRPDGDPEVMRRRLAEAQREYLIILALGVAGLVSMIFFIIVLRA
jgi:hypothetical protein